MVCFPRYLIPVWVSTTSNVNCVCTVGEGGGLLAACQCNMCAQTPVCIPERQNGKQKRHQNAGVQQSEETNEVAKTAKTLQEIDLETYYLAAHLCNFVLGMSLSIQVWYKKGPRCPSQITFILEGNSQDTLHRPRCDLMYNNLGTSTIHIAWLFPGQSLLPRHYCMALPGFRTQEL